jgi:hypothetical protein
MKPQLLKRILRKILRISSLLVVAVTNEKQFSAINRWAENSYSSPSPNFVKQSIVLSNVIPDSTTVETGTYMGETTELLETKSMKVISIEPEKNLFRMAQLKFAGKPKFQIINGTSEDIFPLLIPTLSGDVSFWLDGHFSSGITYRGPKETPILDELSIIEANIGNLQRVVVMVDDIRCFDPTLPEYSTYPTRTYLVEWAGKNGLSWTIEHDIFIAKNFT